MSFLGDLVNSIGTNKAPILPKPLPKQPISSSAAHSNPASRPKAAPSTAPPPITGLKRKLDERDAQDTKVAKPLERVVKPNPAPGLSSKLNQRPISQLSNGVKPSIAKPPPKPAPLPSSAPVKAPTKGSYAEIMARAKEAQQSRVPNPVGTIKHQTSHKEKISKLAERRRQEQEKLKVQKGKRSDKPGPSSKSDRKRGTSPVKKSEPAKVPRAPRPPLHAPASSSSYKGTMGKSAKRPREERAPRTSRYDEYLGTDEEDNSEEDGYGDEDDGYGYSDASSDMEAGLDDIDVEENQALRAAKEDDARELAYENQLKREKEERKRRLEAMARKGR